MTLWCPKVVLTVDFGTNSAVTLMYPGLLILLYLVCCIAWLRCCRAEVSTSRLVQAAPALASNVWGITWCHRSHTIGFHRYS